MMIRLGLLLVLLLHSTVVLANSGIIQRGGYLAREDVQAFVTEMNTEHGVAETELRAILAQVEKQTRVLELIQKPAEFKPWSEYRPIFLTSDRIKKGVQFYKKHLTLLQRASEEYGVPPEIITAIIGVETFYGTRMGKTPVLDALVTLGFDYPPRSKFFRSELKHLILLSREEEIDPLDLHGSYAGAIGMGQFIPSSYRNYSIDFDGDGQRDLRYNTADAIGSVANYFKRHRWKTGAAVISRAKVKGKGYKKLKANERKPKFSLAELKQAGISPTGEASDDEKLVYLKLQGKKGDEHWVGHHNFFVITQYNHSVKYAMAVYQLSQEIKSKLAREGLA